MIRSLLPLVEERPPVFKIELPTPENSQMIFIDRQPQLAFGVQSIDRQTLKNNTVALAKSGWIFGGLIAAAILTTLRKGNKR